MHPAKSWIFLLANSDAQCKSFPCRIGLLSIALWQTYRAFIRWHGRGRDYIFSYLEKGSSLKRLTLCLEIFHFNRRIASVCKCVCLRWFQRRSSHTNPALTHTNNDIFTMPTRKFAVVLVNSFIVATLLFQTPLLFYNGSIVLGALDVVPRSPLFLTIVCTDGVRRQRRVISWERCSGPDRARCLNYQQNPTRRSSGNDDFFFLALDRWRGTVRAFLCNHVCLHTTLLVLTTYKLNFLNFLHMWFEHFKITVLGVSMCLVYINRP